MKNYSYDGVTINLSPSGTSYSAGEVVDVREFYEEPATV